MYKVVGHPRSRTMRVLWLLEELGLPYELDPARPWSPELVARNPEGKAPVLETSEGLIRDSVAIMLFLADRHAAPDGPSHPPGSYPRAVQDAHLLFLVDELDGALWAWARHKMRLEEAADPAFEAECRAGFDRGIERLAVRVGDGPFLMGERFTLPDIIAGHAAAWAKMYEWPIEHAVAAEYLARVAARPSSAQAMKRAAEVMAAARSAG